MSAERARTVDDKSIEPKFNYPSWSGLNRPEIIGKPLQSDGKAVTDIEKQVSQAPVDLETNDDVQSRLKELYIVGIKEVEMENKSATTSANYKSHKIDTVVDRDNNGRNETIATSGKNESSWNILDEEIDSDYTFPLPERSSSSCDGEATHDPWETREVHDNTEMSLVQFIDDGDVTIEITPHDGDEGEVVENQEIQESPESPPVRSPVLESVRAIGGQDQPQPHQDQELEQPPHLLYNGMMPPPPYTWAEISIAKRLHNKNLIMRTIFARRAWKTETRSRGQKCQLCREVVQGQKLLHHKSERCFVSFESRPAWLERMRPHTCYICSGRKTHPQHAARGCRWGNMTKGCSLCRGADHASWSGLCSYERWTQRGGKLLEMSEESTVEWLERANEKWRKEQNDRLQ